MCMLHLNSQVRQYDGFTPRRRVFGTTPKIPIGSVGSRNFNDFVLRKNPPCDAIGRIFKMLFFGAEFKFAVGRLFSELGNAGFFFSGRRIFFRNESGK